MANQLLFIFLLFAMSFAKAQTMEPAAHITLRAPTDSVYTLVETSARFPKGTKEFIRFIFMNTHYPELARQNRIEGQVTISFVIELDGSVDEVRVLKGLSPDIDQEAVRVVSKSPAWEPAFQRGKPVRSRFIVPVNFTL
jgi:TonB family protein